MSDKLVLRSSKVATFLHCRKKYYWEYIEWLAPKETSKPLQVGTLVHKLLDLYYKQKLTKESIDGLPSIIEKLYPNNTSDLTTEVLDETARLMMGYISYWENDPLNVVASEVLAEKEYDNFILRVRVDALARRDKELWRLEHKTAARTDSAYLNGLKGGIQGVMYDTVVEDIFKEQIKGTIYNMLVKTKIPQFLRSFSPTNFAMRERVLETLAGVARDIQSGDFYPSSQCFYYNRSCEFLPLCNHDSPGVREAFYVKRNYSPDDREAVEEN